MSSQPENQQNDESSDEESNDEQHGQYGPNETIIDKTLVYGISDIGSYEEIEIRMHVFVEKLATNGLLHWKVETNVPYNMHTKRPYFHPFSLLNARDFDMLEQVCSEMGGYVPDNELLRMLFTHLSSQEILETQYGTHDISSVIRCLIISINSLWD